MVVGGGGQGCKPSWGGVGARTPSLLYKENATCDQKSDDLLFNIEQNSNVTLIYIYSCYKPYWRLAVYSKISFLSKSL